LNKLRLTWYTFLEAELNPGHIELSNTMEKAPATPGIDPGTFRLVAHCLNHYAIYLEPISILLHKSLSGIHRKISLCNTERSNTSVVK
jgi:hypothetical protein